MAKRDTRGFSARAQWNSQDGHLWDPGDTSLGFRVLEFRV